MNRFKNLISNALKFIPERRVNLHISITSHDSSLIAFSEKDTGIAIAKEKQQLIFQACGGTGRELPISRKLTSLLGAIYR